MPTPGPGKLAKSCAGHSVKETEADVRGSRKERQLRGQLVHLNLNCLLQFVRLQSKPPHHGLVPPLDPAAARRSPVAFTKPVGRLDIMVGWQGRPVAKGRRGVMRIIEIRRTKLTWKSRLRNVYPQPLHANKSPL